MLTADLANATGALESEVHRLVDRLAAGMSSFRGQYEGLIKAGCDQDRAAADLTPVVKDAIRPLYTFLGRCLSQLEEPAR